MIPYHWQYLPLFLQILAAFGLGLVMVVASWLVGRHRNTPVKLAPYECGIEATGDARQRFSVRFYMVAMLFILFDVEMVFHDALGGHLPQTAGNHRLAALRLLGDGGFTWDLWL
jgi:NADH:ubiquinone oxidoreductase subunit 3 (subunit A)